MERKTSKTAGSLKVSDKVLIKIASLAASEVEGVAADGERLAVQDINIITEQFYSPVRVRLLNETAEIETDIIILKGYKAVSVAEAVQQAVKSAVQNMTGIAVSKVNVKVAGIRFTEDEQ